MADIVDLTFTKTGTALAGGSAEVTLKVRFSAREQAEDFQYGVIIVLYEEKEHGQIFIRAQGVDSALFQMLPVGPIASAAEITFNGLSAAQKVNPQALSLDAGGVAELTDTITIPAGKFAAGSSLAAAARIAPEVAEAAATTLGQVFP